MGMYGKKVRRFSEKTSGRFHQKPEVFYQKARNVFPKARRLFSTNRSFPSGFAQMCVILHGKNHSEYGRNKTYQNQRLQLSAAR